MKQMIASDEVWRLFEPYESYAKQSQAMADVLQYFNKIMRTNKSITSIYLINKQADYVLTDSKYKLNDFFDQDILQLKEDKLLSILPPRKIVTVNGPERNILSVVRLFKNVSSNETMQMVINMDYREFISNLQIADNPEPWKLIIFNDNNELILNDTKLEQTSLQEELPLIRAAKASSIRKTISDTDYFMSKTFSDYLGWTVVYAQPFEQVVDSAKLLRHVLMYSLLLVLLFAFIMAYLFSFYLYRPIARIVADIRNRMTKIGKGKDEYSLIGGAVNTLFQENHALQSQFGLAFPFMKQHALFELLSGKVWDDDKFRAIIQLLGKSFDHPRYAIGVMEFENMELTDVLVNEVELFFDERLQTMLLSTMNERRLALIVNTELERDGIYALFGELKASLNDQGVQISLAISPVFDNLNKLFLAYQDALQLLNRKFFIGKNEIIVKESVQAADSNGRFYDKLLEESLLDYIRTQKMDEALETSNTLIRSLGEQSSSIDYVKYAIFQICSNLIGAMADMGGRLEEMGINGPSIWENVQHADTITELNELLVHFIRKSIDVMTDLKQRQHTEIVSKTIEFLKRNYQVNLSLKEISANVFLSPNYLSTIFKTETGKTIFDYMTEIRMEAAVALLVNPEVKIQDVSQAVGYNNSQSFTRLFKKMYSMTPLEYRRKHILTDT